MEVKLKPEPTLISSLLGLKYPYAALQAVIHLTQWPVRVFEGQA